jgi:hypothetical protein
MSSEEDTFDSLTKKIEKVEKSMKKLLSKNKEDSSDYRSYEKKKEGYTKLLMKTKEYRANKLKAFQDDMHADSAKKKEQEMKLAQEEADKAAEAQAEADHERELEDHEKAIEAARLAQLAEMKTPEYRQRKLKEALENLHGTKKEASSADSVSSSESKPSEAETKLYKAVLKKHDKVEVSLQELRDEHGPDDAPKRKDYKKYETKQTQYLEELATTKEWPAEKKRRDEKQAQEEADRDKKQAQEEADRAAKAQAKLDREKEEKQKAVAAARRAEQAEPKTKEFREQKLKAALADMHAFSAKKNEQKAVEDADRAAQAKVQAEQDREEAEEAETKTPEYRQRKLKEAFENLHKPKKAVSSADSEPKKDVDHKAVLKKLDKLELYLKELRDEHGYDEAPKLKEYEKYAAKQKQYLEDLATTKEWPAEKKRRDVKQAQEDEYRAAQARFKAERDREKEEHQKLVAAAREAHQVELDKAKAETLAKLRKKSGSVADQEKASKLYYAEARKAADLESRKESGTMEEDLLKIEEGYNTLLYAQEDLGLIRLAKPEDK